MQDVALDLASRNSFLTRDLVITPDLVGSFHEFVYEDRGIKISLPSAEPLPTEPNEGRLLTFKHYKESNGGKIPQEFWVHVVDVTVLIPEPVSLPKDILKRHPNADDIVHDGKQKQLNRLAEQNESIAKRAFDLWIRVLRWKSDNGAIGRPEVQGHESGWGTYLVTESSSQGIWIWRGAFQVKASRVVTPQIWQAAGSALTEGLAPPIYLELMFDAIEHIKLGDLQRAVVDMAVGCESFLRLLVPSSLPPGILGSIKKYRNNANIRTVLKKFVPQILNEEEQKKLKKIEGTLDKLFDTRNDILHVGRVDSLTPTDCQKYLEVTRALLRLSV